MVKKLYSKFLQILIRRTSSFIDAYIDKAGKVNLPQFANQPKNLIIELPRRISHPERMYIGDNSKFGPGCMLKVTARYPGTWMQHPEGQHINQSFNARLVIGNNVTATSNLHLAVTKKITIGDDVMFASNVFLSDCSHGYDRADVPYKYQGLTNIAPITIKRGCWICQNVVILPGVTIGENVIIGANSIVQDDIPDRCIAVGNPARVVKKWDDETQQWQSVNVRKPVAV